MAKFLYVDGNSIGYASQNTNKLTVGSREVQAIYGTLRSLRAALGEFPGYKPLVLWDHKAQWRFDLLPEYKSKRNKDEKSAAMKKAYKEQQPDIMRALYGLGINQLLVRGAEADDMAGVLSAKATENGNQVALITGDQDWLQLVNEHVRWHDPIRKRHVNHNTFAEFTGYATARQFLEGKALTGDNSDNIPGVGGIGKKGAPEFLMQYGSVEEFFRLADAGALPEKLPKAHSRFANNECPPPSRAKDAPPSVPMRDAYWRNMKLMNLIDAPKPDPSLVKVTRGNFNPTAFKEFCEELAFASILTQFDTWIKPFENVA